MRRKKNSTERRLIAVLLTALPLLTIGCSKKSGNLTEPDKNTRTYRVMKIKEPGTIRIIGNIEADRYSEMGFLTGGKIRKIHVKQGQDVKKEELLAELESERDLLNIKLKKAELEKELYSGSPRQAEIIKQELLALNEDLEKKKIFAPFNGRIVKIKAVEGENFQNENETWMISLINRERMKALVNIQERDIPRIAVGQAVEFSFDTIPAEVFTGKVSSLSPVGKVINGYAQMETELIMENPDPRIYPGYSFSALIAVSEAKEMLVLPRNVIEWKDDQIFVSLCDEPGNIIERREIEASPLNRNQVMINSGLKEGDMVTLPITTQESDMGMLF